MSTKRAVTTSRGSPTTSRPHLRRRRTTTTAAAATTTAATTATAGIGQQLQGHAQEDGLLAGPAQIRLHRATGGLCLQ